MTVPSVPVTRLNVGKSESEVGVLIETEVSGVEREFGTVIVTVLKTVLVEWRVVVVVGSSSVKLWLLV